MVYWLRKHWLQKTEALEVPQIHLLKSPNSCFSYVRKGKIAGTRDAWDHRHLGANRDPGKSRKSPNLLVSTLMPPANLSSVLRLLQIFDKFVIILYEFPYLFCRDAFWQRRVLPKAQASSRIPPIINISVARAVSLKAMGKIRAGIKTESKRSSKSLCSITTGIFSLVLYNSNGISITVSLLSEGTKAGRILGACRRPHRDCRAHSDENPGVRGFHVCVTQGPKNRDANPSAQEQ